MTPYELVTDILSKKMQLLDEIRNSNKQRKKKNSSRTALSQYFEQVANFLEYALVKHTHLLVSQRSNKNVQSVYNTYDQFDSNNTVRFELLSKLIEDLQKIDDPEQLSFFMLTKGVRVLNLNTIKSALFLTDPEAFIKELFSSDA